MSDVPQNCFDMINDIRMEDTLKEAKRALFDDNFQQAAQLFTAVMAEDGYDNQHLLDRCICYMNLGQFEKALSDAKLVIQRDPSNIKAYLMAGRATVMLKRFEDALALYQGGLQIDPKDKDIAQDLRDMQKVIVEEYESKGSEKGYSAVKFCSQDPYPGDHFLLKQEEEILAKKFLDKIQHFEKGSDLAVTKRNPKAAAAEAMTGEQHRMRGDFPRAVHHLTLAVQHDPINFAIRFLRAKAYLDSGDTQRAVADFMAIPKPARHRDIWKTGGTALTKLGLPVMAELWLRRATKLSDQDDDECLVMFQQIRVKRLYDPLTAEFPVDVRFTQYGRAVFAKTNIEGGTIVLQDEPIICGNSLDTWKLPACHHCGRSMLSAVEYFGSLQHLSETHRKIVRQNWPEIIPVPCDLCQKEVYCSATCKTEAWERYHRVLCVSKCPQAEKLYEICENDGKMYIKSSRSWEEVWSAVYTPFILAKMWAFVVCDVRRQMEEEGVEEPTLEHWAKAKAPLRRFIAFGSANACSRFPVVHQLMRDIFTSCDPVVQYDITDTEFNGRYYQASCNLQSFSSPLNPYKLFLNRLNEVDVEKTMSMLSLVETKPKDAIFTGLFPLHACLNHSCFNNVEVMDGLSNDKPGVWVKAKRDVPANEELFTTYIDTKMPRKLRRAWLYRSFNFWCQCRRCQFEGDDPQTCTHCLTAAAPSKKFPACGKCKKAWYCSVKCQKESWQRGHREIYAERAAKVYLDENYVVHIAVISLQTTDPTQHGIPPPHDHVSKSPTSSNHVGSDLGFI